MKKFIVLLICVLCCFGGGNMLYAKWPYFVECDNGTFGFIRVNGEMLVACGNGYDVARDFSEGFAAVGKGDKSGFIDENAKEVVSMKYDWVYSFSGTMAVVNRADKCGFINVAGKEVVPCKYEDAWSFSEVLAVVARNSKS
jgi:hypothetical protein